MYGAIDVGGSKTRIGVFDKLGNLSAQKSFKTSADSEEFLDQTIKEYKKILGTPKPKTIGLALPCSFMSSSTIQSCGNLPWKGVDLVSPLSEKLSARVLADNDANLGALAEARLGAGQEYRTVLYITLSTGVGTGIIIDKKINAALKDSEGGQMVITDDGSEFKRLEDLVSGPAVEERFGLAGPDITDPNIWDAYARDLAAGVFNMITLIFPEVVILGGGMSLHYPLFHAPLIKYLKQLNPGLYPIPSVKQAKFPETAVLYGCYLLAKDAI